MKSSGFPKYLQSGYGTPLLYNAGPIAKRGAFLLLPSLWPANLQGVQRGLGGEQTVHPRNFLPPRLKKAGAWLLVLQHGAALQAGLALVVESVAAGAGDLVCPWATARSVPCPPGMALSWEQHSELEGPEGTYRNIG